MDEFIYEDIERKPEPCPSCGSKNNYFRTKTKEYVCRRCGHAWRTALGQQLWELQNGRKE